MKSLKDFRINEIKNANKVKGGEFCDWYITQKDGENTENAGILMKNVDGVMVKNENKNFV